jgi:hypothetical protein
MNGMRRRLRNLYSSDQVKIINKFRLLWDEHMIWTRAFIISTAANLPDIDAVTARLLRNPDDFAKVLSQFYGMKKANEFGRLLREHLLIAANLVNAAKAGDTNTVTSERKKWYDNATDIAVFLDEINPFWDKQQWQRLLFSHLKMVEDEAVFRLNGQYEKDIAIFDDIVAEGHIMADLMSNGIFKQFHV